jgi:sulfite reductase (ferredoxin)
LNEENEKMFKLPEEVVKSIGDFKNALEDFKDGRMSPDRFRGVRVPWGLYSQRGGEIFMARVRIPAGVVSPKQLKALGDCSQKYGSGVLHVTTRQDIQIHDVKVEDTEYIIEYLKAFDLSPRGGGGNTVRNITACPFAGICGKEAFDVRSYAISLTEFLLRDSDSYMLPRKYKIAFSGCGEDCALATLADVGFIAKEESPLKGEFGFSVYAGGGMGMHSRVGQLLEQFIRPQDAGYVAEAVKRVFFKHGERRNRHRARLRFLVEKLGFEQFKNLYKRELEELKETSYIALRKVEFGVRNLEFGMQNAELPVSSNEEFEVFKAYNVSLQQQKGYFTVGIRLPLGDIQAEKLIKLTEIADEFETTEFRTSQDQNIYICNVKGNAVYPLYEKLKELKLASPYVSTIFDPVVCQGASTCNLGLCDSKALAHDLVELLGKDGLNPEFLNGFNIRINGCPNACGHHPKGVIGLHGLVRKVGMRPVPFYKILLGGRVGEGRTKLAQEMGIVPARNVPYLLKEFLKASQEKVREGRSQKSEYDNVYDYLEKEGKSLMGQLIEKFAYVPPYEENITFYRDFGKEEDFTLAGIGPGECGAGVLDLINADLEDAQIKLNLLGRSLALPEKQNYDVSLLSEVLHLSARALLVVRGIEPKNSEEAINFFLNQFIHTNIASERFKDLKEKFLALKEVKEAKEKEKLFIYAKEFHQEVKDIYSSMDSSFNFPPKVVSEEKEKKEDEEESPKVLDLKGTPCPINYVKVKLFLENLEPGAILDIYLDEGEPISNVPKSLENDGHKILRIEKSRNSELGIRNSELKNNSLIPKSEIRNPNSSEGGFYKVRVEKGGKG